MDIFDTQDSFTVPLGPDGMESVRRAILAFLDFHKAEYVEDTTGEFRFTIPFFLFSSRNKPLHRFQHGVIAMRQRPEGEAEVSFALRLSKANIVGCIVSVLAGLAIAIAMVATGETPLWWALAAALAGPFIAYTGRDQCVTRVRAALLEAALLAQRKP